MKAVAFALMFAASAAQAEPALTSRVTDLLAQAQSDAAKLASLPENTRVEVVKRSGAWSEVKTGAGQSGWVRMLHLKTEDNAAAGARSAPSAAGALASLLGSGRTASNATVTTGVRGLRKEDLQQARPNPEEFKKMQQQAITRDAAQAFARSSKLNSARLEYLPEPASAPPSGGESGGATSGLMGG